MATAHLWPQPRQLPDNIDSEKLKLTIAVTGGPGRIGSWVVQAALEDGHRVVSMDRLSKGPKIDHPDYRYRQVDFLDYEAFDKAMDGCNALIHLAGVFNLRDANNERRDIEEQERMHNVNVCMSYNALNICWLKGIERCVLASSVNVIGMVGSDMPRYDYLPLDEDHPVYHMDAYSISKYIVEIQADSFVRRQPGMRIATLRFSDVTPEEQCNPAFLDQRGGVWRDLWGWISATAAAQAAILGLTAPFETFPRGTHETFFIVADTIQQQTDSLKLLRTRFPHMKHIQEEYLYQDCNKGFYDTSKAHKMLGWHGEHRFWWHAASASRR